MNIFTTNYPYLETYCPTTEQAKIIEAFQDIKEIGICWLAHEELEHRYGDIFSAMGIDCIKNRTSMDFIHRSRGIALAKIHFDKNLNTTQHIASNLALPYEECSF